MGTGGWEGASIEQVGSVARRCVVLLTVFRVVTLRGKSGDRWLGRCEQRAGRFSCAALCCAAQRIPKLQQHDQAVWWDTLAKMQKLLRKAAATLHAAGKMDKDLMHNYFMSGEPSSRAAG